MGSIHACCSKWQQALPVPFVFFCPSPLPCFSPLRHPCQLSVIVVGLKFGSLIERSQTRKAALFHMADRALDGVLVRPELRHTPPCRILGMSCQ